MAAMSFLTSSQRSLASTMSFAVLYSSNTSQQVPEFLLWFFDSRGGNYYQELTPAGGGVPQPNWVDLSWTGSQPPARSFAKGTARTCPL